MADRESGRTRDAALLLDMLMAARAVVAFVAGRSSIEYTQDLMLRSAVERQIEIIGEAARAVSATCKAAHPEIAWRAIMAQRHRLAHEYGAINDEIIWRVAMIHIPELIARLVTLIPRVDHD